MNEIILNSLKSLNSLNTRTESLTPDGIREVITIIESKMFHLSDKNFLMFFSARNLMLNSTRKIKVIK